jgi:hypothetical protein
MGTDNRFWNRDELYEEVWATPMQTLAKKYGISDVGLAKICRKLVIPVSVRSRKPGSLSVLNLIVKKSVTRR